MRAGSDFFVQSIKKEKNKKKKQEIIGMIGRVYTLFIRISLAIIKIDAKLIFFFAHKINAEI